MFLYWKKRGTYELEALPSDLAELELGAVERFSWSSTPDIIEDLGGRCGPTFPGGLSGGCNTWSTWPPPFGQSLWPDHQAHGTVSHSLSSNVGPELLLRALLVGEGPDTRALGPRGSQADLWQVS